ncbi:calcium-binding protein [Variovorax rhizosphaerae]|uniref:Calcium-binding protein n=1 Tax=Variovorax rhizosphaerae TaxID=1836200 RepID=A0ABU8WS01_9BURK
MQAQLAQFAAGTTKAQQQASLDALIQSWGATSAMPTSLQANRTLANPAAGAGSITAIEQFAQNNPALYAQMTALEQFNGQTILDKWVRSSGSSFVVSYSAEQAVLINQAYDALKDSVYVALVVQTRLKPYLDSIELMVDEAGVHFDTTALASKVDAAITSDSRNGITDLIELNLFANSTLREVGFDGIATLRAQIAALPVNAPVLAELASLHVLQGSATGTDFAEIYLGNAGNNDIFARDGDDVVDGGAGDDNIRGESGNDTLLGGAGNDALSGGAGNDTFDGGAGNDTAYGDGGNDTYLFGRGDGQDTVIDYDATVGNIDRVIFKAGVAVSDVQVSRNGDALVFKINGTTDQLQVQSYFNTDATNGSQVEEIRFTDAPDTVWTVADVKALVLTGGAGNDYMTGFASADVINGWGGNDDIFGRDGDDVIDGGTGDDNIRGESGNDTLLGGAGNDALSGLTGNDTFDGGAGNDTAYGDGGNDTYLFGRGDGQDTMIDTDSTAGNVDRLVFKAGVAVADVVASRDGDTLVLKIAGTTDQARVQNYFTDDATNRSQIEEIRFTDAPNTVWTVADIKTLILTGTASNDNLTGFASADVMNGLDGNDDIYGRDGDDVIDGGAGNDTLLGGTGNDALSGLTGNDTFDGGAGNDIMYGDGGNDVFLFGKGDGQDTIVDTDTTIGNVDQIIFKAGVAVSDVQVSRNGDTLVLKISGTSDQTQVSNYFRDDATNGSQIEAIRFTDAPNTVWSVADVKSLVLSGTAGNDTLSGTAAADVINGFGGNDDIYGREGDDVIDGGAGDDNIRGESGNDTLLGGAGNDALSGLTGNDTFDGGAGNDTAYGDGGNDTYLFGRGDDQDTVIDTDSTAGNVDRLVFKAGVAVADVVTSRDGDTLVLKIAGTTDQVRVSNYFANDAVNSSLVEEIRFTDAADTVWTVAAMKTMVLTGTAGNDNLQGYATNDTLSGGGGNDDIYGRSGDDVIDGGRATTASGVRTVTTHWTVARATTPSMVAWATTPTCSGVETGRTLSPPSAIPPPARPTSCSSRRGWRSAT